MDNLILDKPFNLFQVLKLLRIFSFLSSLTVRFPVAALIMCTLWAGGNIVSVSRGHGFLNSVYL